MVPELSEEEKQEVQTAKTWITNSKLWNRFGWAVVGVIGLAQMLGYSPSDALTYVKAKIGAPQAVVSEPVQAALTPEQIADLIEKIVDKLKPPPEPAPAPQPVPNPGPTPAPAPPKPEPVVSELKIQITTESGESLAGTEVQAGQVIRISAINAGEKIGWQPVSNGEVHLIASTDGKEYFGYLTSGSWLQLGLTDFASQKQISMRVTCNQAPQPPPIPVPPEPKPNPQPEPPKPVPPPPAEVSLVVVHDSRHASVESSILMNSNVWQQFKKQGNEYLWVEEPDNSQEAKKYKADLEGVPIPALLIYDKKTGRKLAAMPRPKNVEELKVVVYSYTGGED